MASKSRPPADVSHAKPSSVLRNFMHKRTASDGAALTPATTPKFSSRSQLCEANKIPVERSHPRPLMELHQNRQSQSPSPKKTKAPSNRDNGHKSLHKKTLSSISLKSLAGRDTEKNTKPKDKDTKVTKQKKTTNLSNLLSRPKSMRNLRKEAAELDIDRAARDKENQSPNTPAQTDVSSNPPPIYAQFSSTQMASPARSRKMLQDEISLYTPREYDRTSQRDFYDAQPRVPTLKQYESELQRPKSTYLPSSFSLQDMSTRMIAGSSELAEKSSEHRRPNPDDKKLTPGTVNSAKRKENQNQRGAKGTSNGTQTATPAVLDDKDVDREFEAMLDRRNIPEHQRGKMRSLTLLMKRDFIRQDCAEIAAAKNMGLGTNSSDSSAEATCSTTDLSEVKSKRPRSLTFTLSRGSGKDSSPTKKMRPQAAMALSSRTNSSDSVSGKSKTLAQSSAAAAQSLVAKAKGQLSDDFVSYLRKVQKPELVEVGRLHKLRILLRNETVAWIEGFIGQGGMREIVGLLHRTMEVEWREEHEDALLHEVLLCLKALVTTDLALRYIEDIQETLFPALLHLIFDEEKKGPSEFTTRNIITSVLFTYLKSAPLSEREVRAKCLLTHLKDPEPAESDRPVEFVLEMRRSRPYQVWCKEAVNVTKEVFWIFLHNLNVIVLPSAGKNGNSAQDQDISHSIIASAMSDSTFDVSNLHHVYMTKHFPPELPPVPAAPYVGGVEWDATNYLASHIDIINGILASIPTREERNTLREQMRVSGWEKCMGGTLRLCKEKFYGCVHAALRCWVAAAAEDGWDTKDVRCGPTLEQQTTVRKNVKKTAAAEPAPKIEMKLDFGHEEKKALPQDDVWL